MENFNHFYAGCSTPRGFVNHFHSIIAPDKKGFTFILKGGPGTGKSSLMKRLAARLIEEGRSVEFYHCSFDPSSLDGICVSDSGIAVVDGTSPHPDDVDVLGVTHRIVNLGELLDGGIYDESEEILRITDDKTELISLAGKYFNAAAGLYAATKAAVSIDGACGGADEIVSEVLVRFNDYKKVDSVRMLFDRTADSDVSILEKNRNDLESVIFDANEYTAPIILREVANRLNKLGMRLTLLMNPLSPDDIRGIYVEGGRIVIRPRMTGERSDRVKFNYDGQMRCTEEGARLLVAARKLHSELESHYIRHMNFEKMQGVEDGVFAQIKSMLK